MATSNKPNALLDGKKKSSPVGLAPSPSGELTMLASKLAEKEKSLSEALRIASNPPSLMEAAAIVSNMRSAWRTFEAAYESGEVANQKPKNVPEPLDGLLSESVTVVSEAVAEFQKLRVLDHLKTETKIILSEIIAFKK
jgi:hypothetical protein